MWMPTLALLLAGCGSQPATEEAKEPEANQATAAQATPATDITKRPDCPFQKTTGWYAQIENTRFSVDGQVDFQMAGFKPGLTKRSASGGGIALDLSLQAAPGEPVTPSAHYEEPMSTAYNRVTIFCGGKEMTSFEPMDQRL